jgi:hypothetical protein
MVFEILGLRIVAVAAHTNSRPCPGLSQLGGLSARRLGARGRLFAAAVAGLALGLSAPAALAHECKPGHFRAPFFIKTMGRCVFDPASLSFQGEPAEQARCLMRGMDQSRNLGPPMEHLPAALADRVGSETGLPSREALSTYLSKLDLEWIFATYLWQPIARANDNDPNAPTARYFVIHDTSSPNFGHRSFPEEIDGRSRFNNLNSFKCSDGWGKAHVVINRAGDMLLNHELSIPWRETKFEQAANFSGALKGLFLHVELIQPRRAAPGHGHNDAQSPNPPFTAAQYDRLALLYVIASVRSNRWLIPAYHAALDADIRNGHDDPLNFDPESFANSIAKVVDTLNAPEQMRVAGSAPVNDGKRPPDPPFSPIPLTDPAELPPSNAVASDASAEPPADARTHAGEHDGATAAKAESEKNGDRKIVAEHCQTYLFKGRRHSICRSYVAAVAAHGKMTQTARLADHRVSHQSVGARYQAGNQNARHERGKTRHGRA